MASATCKEKENGAGAGAEEEKRNSFVKLGELHKVRCFTCEGCHLSNSLKKLRAPLVVVLVSVVVVLTTLF